MWSPIIMIGTVVALVSPLIQWMTCTHKGTPAAAAPGAASSNAASMPQ